MYDAFVLAVARPHYRIDWATLSAFVTVAVPVAGVVGLIWRKWVSKVWHAFVHLLTYLDPLRGIKAHLLEQDGLLREISKELKPNGGSSLSDKVNAIWARQGMSAARVGMLLDESDAMLWQSDLEGRQVWASRALVEITGRSAPDLLGWGWVNVIHPDDRERIRKSWVSCLVEGRNFEEGCRFQTLHGTHYSGQLVAKPFLFDGKVIAWIGRATLEGPPVVTNGDHPPPTTGRAPRRRRA